jgi:sugar lactone lactonase YvrE
VGAGLHGLGEQGVLFFVYHTRRLNVAIQLTKPMIVPEFLNGLVKSYIADPITDATTPRPPFTLDVQSVLSSLIPGKTARPNSCALHGNDLFISNSSPDSQCIFKVPNYLTQPEQAIKETFVFGLDGSDYVGMAFDAAGDLYAAEGNSDDNQIFKYTGTAKAYPGPAAAAGNNYASRVAMGNAGATSYFANLAFDAAGNLWASDYLNHRIVVFKAGGSAFRVLNNLVASIPVANTNAALSANTSHLFAEPEGLDFDAAGNLWVANNNDGNAGGVQTTRTSLVMLTPAIQQELLNKPAGGSLTPAVQQSNDAFFVYQVPNLANNLGARPQFGGLQIDKASGRIFVNEQVVHKGRWYDIATIAAIGTSTAANGLDIVSTNPGNGGIALVQAAVPLLYIQDNAADTGAEPNSTTGRAWESPHIWANQSSGAAAGGLIIGGSKAFVNVRVTNRGLSPSDGSDVVKLYWAKASTGLSFPSPWDGLIPARGGEVALPQAIPTIQPGQSAPIEFTWPITPNPADYPGSDGHFCLLARIAPPGTAQFAGFTGTDLNENVLNLSKVAWRNIHIEPAAAMKIGNILVANYTARDMDVQIAFEILDAQARPVDPARARLLITPKGTALEKIREQQFAGPYLEDLGHGRFQVLDIATGISHLKLRPGEVLPFGLEYVPDHEAKGYVVRATQYSLAGASRKTIGGQTFVAGDVEGFTTTPERRRRSSFWPWVIIPASLLLLIALLGRRRKEETER